MLSSSFIALAIAFGMGLLSLSSQEEIATVLCGAIAIICFILSLVLASWQIQLALVLLLIGTYNYCLSLDP